jgi:GTP-binding protein
MQITKARFLKSMKAVSDYPDIGLPEIALCGRSNVGKSTLINLLTNNQKMARTSASPGKTRLVNFFVINEQFLLVDLPGYGYAKAAKSEKETWPEMIEGYLDLTRNLKALLILLDIRRDPSEEDLRMFEWAAHYGLYVIIAATKADKIAKTKRFQRIKEIKQKMGIDYPAVAVSSLEKTGQRELLDEIESVLL